jgi:hypothetical protein
MTAPQAEATTPTPRSTRKRDPKNAEALAGAKKVADALPAAAPAKKAPAKAPAKKAPAKATSTRVAPLPRDQWRLPKPAKLVWEAKTVRDVDYQVAEGARHLYRVHRGDDGGWWAQQKLKAGSWSAMAGVCKTVEEAKTLAGFNEAGALWLAYSSVTGTPFDKLVETYGASK